MRVFVTGASGFLGHRVCSRLASRDHEVVALVRRPGSEPAGTVAAAGDLTEPLTAVLAEHQPECVVHLAAEIASQRDKMKLAAVNVAGTKRLLEACVQAGVKRFLFAST